jgi:hypothetical protein
MIKAALVIAVIVGDCPGSLPAAAVARPTRLKSRTFTSQRLRLALETGEALRVARDGVGQDFDRHVAIEFRVAGTVHLAHPPCSDGAGDHIGPLPSAAAQRP